MKRALMVWGGWEGHEPEQCVALFRPFLEEEGYEVHVTDTLAVLTEPAIMQDLDLFVPCISMGEISSEQAAALIAAVKGGVGIAGWHGGLCDAFRANTEYQYMTGGQFVAHPGGIIDYTVNIIRPDDPIVQGIQDFNVHTEQYYLHVDPSNEVLATTTFSGAHDAWIVNTVMPVVWKRRFGQGRVFYCALGHVARDFEVPEVSEIMRRGLLWAGR
jgi:uncharacterized protein